MMQPAGKLPPYFTRHAKNRMRARHVSEAEIMAALQDPDQVTPSQHGRWNAWKHGEQGWLRVTYRDEATRRTIITVTRRRQGPTEE